MKTQEQITEEAEFLLDQAREDGECIDEEENS